MKLKQYKVIKKYGAGSIALILFIVFLIPLFSPAQQDSISEYPVSATGFYENKGQIVNQNYEPNSAVKYLLSTPGFNVQLRQTGFSYDTYTDSVVSEQSSVPARMNPARMNLSGWRSDGVSQKMLIQKGKEIPSGFIRHYHRVDIELQGCNPNAVLVAEGKSEVYYTYITASTPDGGIDNVHYYQKVIYKNIYPEIDLEFFITNSENGTSTVNGGATANDEPARAGSDGLSPNAERRNGAVGVEYNFVVHPGGNPDDIKLTYKGANYIKLDEGKLNVNVSAGNFVEKIPSAYWKDTKKPVEINYKDFGNATYGFSIVNPDSYRYPFSSIHSTSDLIIDPVPNLAWGTYYSDGGTVGFAIAIDASDNVYVTGQTESATGIATSGAYQINVGSSVDAFVAKFNSTGTSLIWGTYFGRAASDITTIGTGIVVDANDNVYITGYTSNPSGIATAGAFQTTYGGGGDAFIAKFNSTGSSLLWGTYYGGTADDQGNGIAVDTSGNVYITGYTDNSTGLATTGAYQVTGGTQSAFIAKFNPSGSSLIWGTYLGGSSGITYGNAIAVDSKGGVYITGATTCTTGIATPGAYQAGYAGGDDAFVAKLNPTGTSLLWGTYYGGADFDYGYAISLDASDNTYITGYTKSTSGIATSGAFQTSLGGTQSAFAAKINSSGTALLWGTYYGGNGVTYGYGITTDMSGNLYITGQTTATAGIATTGSYQSAYSGSGDAFVAMFTSAGNTLLWGTYYEGTGTGEGVGIAADASGNVYITGYTTSTSGIATTGAYNSSYNGTSDNAFVAEFNGTILPLPIILTSFNADYMEESNSVLTDWVVASQLNNSEFVVQKTQDGTNYENIDSVPGAGTTPFSESYSAVDNNPLSGVSYYRLEQIDVDGHTTEFPPVAVFIGNNQNSSVNIYPNPVTFNATLIYLANDRNPLTVEIVDMTGKTVSSFSLNNVQIGENNFSINASSLSRGVYILRASEELKEYTLKFVKE